MSKKSLRKEHPSQKSLASQRAALEAEAAERVAQVEWQDRLSQKRWEKQEAARVAEDLGFPQPASDDKLADVIPLFG